MFSKKKEEGGAPSTTSSARNSLFKVVHNKRQSILDTGHPAGWINRTTEREEAALKGQDWHSEAYVLELVGFSPVLIFIIIASRSFNRTRSVI
jgi:hypothetical protein